MKLNTRAILLGIYDLWLAKLAISTGLLMIQSDKGIFTDYPSEWLSKVPFSSWFIPGIVAITFFGLGNIISAIYSFISKKPWIYSSIMAGILFISLIFQIILLGESYLATGQLLILSVIQLSLSWYVFKSRKLIKKG